MISSLFALSSDELIAEFAAVSVEVAPGVFDEDEEDVSREDDETATIAEVLRLLLSAVLVVPVGSLIIVEDGDEVEAPRTCLVDAGVEQQRAAMEDMFNKYIHARELRRNDRSTADVCAFVRSLDPMYYSNIEYEVTHALLGEGRGNAELRKDKRRYGEIKKI